MAWVNFASECDSMNFSNCCHDSRSSRILLHQAQIEITPLKRNQCTLHGHTDLSDDTSTIVDAPDCTPDEMVSPNFYRAEVDLNVKLGAVLTTSRQNFC